ncbi:MAG: type II toxin-antitoxin system RelE/ParE family toxin [Planctomycetota bacterium]
MGEYKIEFSSRALADIDKFPPYIALRIVEKIQILGKDPRPRGDTIKKIVGAKYPLLRLRVGDYRAIYLLEKEVVVILRIIHRKELEQALRDLLER